MGKFLGIARPRRVYGIKRGRREIGNEDIVRI
jgi:hypothetical protein